jgi:phosphoribosylformylglycinamidine synthase
MADQIGVVTFPGSNGDQDAVFAVRESLGAPVRLIDYRETELGNVAALVLPGGFSYGDHLRCGAIARFAPVMDAIQAFAARGGPVLGICNGFQILTEAHLLPGALLRNKSLRFHCHWTQIQIEQTATAWTNECRIGQVLRLPVAHGDGAYFAEATTLARLEGEGRVVARYCVPAGDISLESNELDEIINPNGSLNRIAGITNERGNVVGLMPHPERAADPLVNGEDGLFILRSGLSAVNAGV